MQRYIVKTVGIDADMKHRASNWSYTCLEDIQFQKLGISYQGQHQKRMFFIFKNLLQRLYKRKCLDDCCNWNGYTYYRID